MGFTDEQKARAYDGLTGHQLTEMPLEQRAERWDRRVAKHHAKYRAKGDTGRYTFDSDSPMAAAAWCACGVLKGSTACTCEAATS